MRTSFATVICSALVGLWALSWPALAQQKTAKECRTEWQANKADNQAKGVTEKAYVDQCRGEAATVQPTSAPPTTSTPAPTETTPARKTEKRCRAEWQANKVAYQAGGISEKSYVDKCRDGETVAVPSTPSPTATTPAPAPVSAPSAQPSKTTVTTPTGANQFTTEAQAKGRCPSDTVVWANTKSKVYHFNGYKNYGDTKEGAYMCEKDATAQGFRAARNEKHT